MLFPEDPKKVDYRKIVGRGDRISISYSKNDPMPLMGIAIKVGQHSIEARSLDGRWHGCLYHPEDPMIVFERPALIETECDLGLFEVVPAEILLREVAAKQQKQDRLLMEMSAEISELKKQLSVEKARVTKLDSRVAALKTKPATKPDK